MAGEVPDVLGGTPGTTADLSSGSGGGVAVNIGEQDPVATVGQPGSNRQADTAARARDDGGCGISQEVLLGDSTIT